MSAVEGWLVFAVVLLGLGTLVSLPFVRGIGCLGFPAALVAAPATYFALGAFTDADPMLTGLLTALAAGLAYLPLAVITWVIAMRRMVRERLERERLFRESTRNHKPRSREQIMNDLPSTQTMERYWMPD
ncbi:hypothetical protein [Streptomyces sp. NPDC049916]|uniref:hypothetical protein n=1 Tax=Streptomyces sp. NPDC049916 TaxID=3155156 RepID=UPI0034403105